MRQLVRSFLAAAFLVGAAVSHSAAQDAHPELGTWGVQVENFASGVLPGDDFYRYVNGKWLKTTKIPEGYFSVDSFLEAALRTEAQLRELITDIVASEPTPGTDAQLIKAFYQSYFDVDRLNALGLKPIQAELDAIMAVKTHEDVARWMARPFAPTIVGFYVGLDAADPKRYVAHLSQAGLGLPVREYYLEPDEPFAGYRAAYVDYIAGCFARAGIDGGKERAADILALETAIAEAQWPQTALRDPVRMYNLMPVERLKTFASGFPWTVFLEEAGYGGETEFVVGTDSAIQRLARLFAETPVDTWRSYLAFHYLNAFSPALSEEWQNAQFAFYSGRLAGIEKRRPLDTRAIHAVDHYVGEPLGRAYVARYFPPEYRAKMDALVDNLRAAYRDHILNNGWMDEPTRTGALAKLDAIVSQIGYPDRWHDYSSLTLDPTDLVGNMRKITALEHADAVRALKEPRRDWEWPYTPQTVNAGYQATRNTITFPAAILQPPFFDPDADPAVNYGAAGAVIGHELGHAFDDEGSHQDAEGRLRNWWTPAARAEFEKRAQVLVGQYDAFSPIEGMHLNGALTLGENIGDLSGITIALDAYRLSVKENGGDAPVIDGYTGEQRVFLAWAQLWREMMTEDAQRQFLLSDPHSPGEFRANGSVRNVDGWYEAFGVKEGDAMYLPPEKRAKIW